MGASVRLSADSVQVVPGSVATVVATVRNTGTVVDQFEMSVLGDAAAWATCDPPVLPLFPATEGQVTVRFAPPRTSTVPAGSVRFGVRASSHEDPSGSTVEEGTVAVAPFAETFAELVPRTSHGSRSATHELAVDNRGNTRLNATVEASDPDQLVGFDVRPPGLVVEPGTAAISRVTVKPRRRFWRGSPQTRPFKLAVTAPDQSPVTLDGSMVQEAMLPRWFFPALLALLALAILALILWLTILQPAIKSAANQALVDAGITPATPGGGGGGGGATLTPAPATPKPGTSAAPGATLAPGSSTSTGFIPGHPVDGRLSIDGTNPTGVTPNNTTLYVTDLIFANPNGRSGTLLLKRGALTIVTLRLENFRDLDYHFVTPIVVQSGQSLVLSGSCTTSPCDPSVLYSGFTSP